MKQTKMLMSGEDLQGRAQVAVGVFLLLAGCAACASGDPHDFDEVRQLLLLEGQQYKDFRDQLLSERSRLWDQRAADDEEGELPLAVFILNARLSDRGTFDALDRAPMMMNIIGEDTWIAPEVDEDAVSVFVIEQTWKGLWSEEMCQAHTLRGVMWWEVHGSAAMWERFAGDSTPPLLRAVATYALARFPGFKDRAAALIADKDAPEPVKLSVFRALKFRQPDFGADLVLETKSHWMADELLRGEALYFLTQHPDTGYRRNLRRWLMDGSLPDATRADIAVHLRHRQDARDLFIYKTLLGSDDCPERLRNTVTTLLGRDVYDDDWGHELYENLIIDAEFPPVIVKGDPIWVTVTLTNPSDATGAVGYVRHRAPEGELVGSLPVGVSFVGGTHAEWQTPAPELEIFLETPATIQDLRLAEGTSLNPGEQISATVEVTETVKELFAGDYRVLSLVWLPPGIKVIRRSEVVRVVDR